MNFITALTLTWLGIQLCLNLTTSSRRLTGFFIVADVSAFAGCFSHLHER